MKALTLKEAVGTVGVKFRLNKKLARKMKKYLICFTNKNLVGVSIKDYGIRLYYENDVECFNRDKCEEIIISYISYK